MPWLLLYIALLLGVGLFEARRGRAGSVEKFVASGRDAGAWTVATSIVALVFGASSVFGMAGLATTVGWNALWWTGSGAIGLLVLRVTFLDRLVSMKGLSVSDVVATVHGEEIRRVVSVTTAVAWLAVLAGQIVAGGMVLSRFVGNETVSYLLFTATFVGYTMIAGQAAAMRTGALQVVLMVAGILLLLAACVSSPGARPADLSSRIGSDAAFTPSFLVGLTVPVFLSYLFGPDVYSRIFAARDRKAARRGVLLATLLVVLVSVPIVALGIVGRGLLPGLAKPDALIPNLVPLLLDGWVADLAVVVLVSIPLSGADIILLTIATLLGRDLVVPGLRRAGVEVGERRSVGVVRVCLAVAAVASLLIALRFKAILPSLLVAYKVFAASIVPLLFASLVALGRGRRTVPGAARKAVVAWVLLSAAAVVVGEIAAPSFLPRNWNLWLALLSAVVLTALTVADSRKAD